MKKKELIEMVREELRFGKFAAGTGKPSKFFIPPFIVFKSSIKDQFKEHFKLVKDAEGEYKLYISPLMKVTLDQIYRGRPSSDYIKTTPGLVKMVTERIPGDVRGLLKKYTTKINSSVNMYPVEVKIAKVSDKGGIAFFNPSSQAGEVDDTTFGESIEEKKLTPAELKKKEDIVKAMKPGFKGDKSSLYAIATVQAKKLAETNIIATDYQFTPEQLKLLYKFGSKSSTSGSQLYVHPKIYQDLELNKANSEFKKEFATTVEIGNETMASQVLGAMKKALNPGNTAEIKGTKYFVLDGHMTKNGNFNFPNPSRPK